MPAFRPEFVSPALMVKASSAGYTSDPRTAEKGVGEIGAS